MMLAGSRCFVLLQKKKKKVNSSQRSLLATEQDSPCRQTNLGFCLVSVPLTHLQDPHLQIPSVSNTPQG